MRFFTDTNITRKKINYILSKILINHKDKLYKLLLFIYKNKKSYIKNGGILSKQKDIPLGCTICKRIDIILPDYFPISLYKINKKFINTHPNFIYKNINDFLFFILAHEIYHYLHPRTNGIIAELKADIFALKYKKLEIDE